MPLSNNYSLRTTNVKDQKPCFICGKSSNSVLDAHDDFFFVCLSHTKDVGFCSEPDVAKVSALVPKHKSAEDKTTPKPSKDSEKTNPDPKPEAETVPEPPKVFIYKLHRSILYLREEEKKRKEKVNLLKSLK